MTIRLNNKINRKIYEDRFLSFLRRNRGDLVENSIVASGIGVNIAQANRLADYLAKEGKIVIHQQGAGFSRRYCLS